MVYSCFCFPNKPIILKVKVNEYVGTKTGGSEFLLQGSWYLCAFGITVQLRLNVVLWIWLIIIGGDFIELTLNKAKWKHIQHVKCSMSYDIFFGQGGYHKYTYNIQNWI